MSAPQILSDAPILAHKAGRAGHIILNRPKALHALTMDMCQSITDALLAWRDDPSVEHVLITHAAGTRGFCAGGDIKLISESGADDGKLAADFFATEYRMNALIKDYPKPYIAIIDGITMGGGVGVSLHGAARIATENTVFAMPETGIGLFPDVGGTYFLPRLHGGLGYWLGITGARLKSDDVLAAGLATHYITSDKLPDLIDDIYAQGMDALTGLQTEATGSFAKHLNMIDRYFVKMSVEEIMAALSADGSDWAQKQLAVMQTKSPLSMKIAAKQLHMGANMDDFHEVMQLEYRLATRIVLTPNFAEGVRAVVIDKDNNPQWQPSALDDVRGADVDAFFAPLENELHFID